MRCPRCNFSDATQVLHTRHRVDGSIRRRHHCSRCRIRWTGIEAIAPGTIVAERPAGLALQQDLPREGLLDHRHELTAD